MILLILPPFVQLNTPYPSTMFLKGFLNLQNIECVQMDLGIETINAIFSHDGLTRIFATAETSEKPMSDNCRRIFSLKNRYIETVDLAIRFLQTGDTLIAYQICNNFILPQANRFNNDTDLDYAFGNSGIVDKAKHKATLFMEDLGDFIIEMIDADFGFSRYAEKISLAASVFEPIENKLKQSPSVITQIMLDLLDDKIKATQPTLIGFSVPFPGNLISSLQCAQYIRQHFSNIPIAMGGGYVSTELRNITDPQIFDYIDYLSLDDGEIPLVEIYNHLKNKDNTRLVRTFICENNRVVYCNSKEIIEPKHSQKGIPDYLDLPLTKYISILEMTNPMHRLWNDGRWNKLMLAHGCYWHQCTFCDTSLNYICHYDPAPVHVLINQIESIISQTGTNGFHFIDEAAPPAVLRNLAIEVLRRGLKISWWANIRFEKSFDIDLCELLAASGCIGVSGGLEVASNRLLKLINKGVSIEQAAHVCNHFTQNGVMVHTYLMYGFPTQTEQETIDSLEIVRQMFDLGLIQSAFWHRFAMTCHSPIGQHPEKFGTKASTQTIHPFANNEVPHDDSTEIDHSDFTAGLNKSLYNYMHEIGLDYPLDYWFDFETPRSTHKKKHIKKSIESEITLELKPTKLLIWIHEMPKFETLPVKSTKNKELTYLITLETNEDTIKLKSSEKYLPWLEHNFNLFSQKNNKLISLQEFQTQFEIEFPKEFSQLLSSEVWIFLRKNGLLII